MTDCPHTGFRPFSVWDIEGEWLVCSVCGAMVQQPKRPPALRVYLEPRRKGWLARLLDKIR